MTDERRDITEPVEKPKAPAWFSRHDFFRAEIDLSDIAEGASAVLRSAKGREAKKINALAQASKEGTISWSCRAATYAAHLFSITGCDALMETKPPESRAPTKDWEDWLDGLDENLIGRVSEAITLFRLDVHSDPADTGESGNGSRSRSED